VWHRQGSGDVIGVSRLHCDEKGGLRHSDPWKALYLRVPLVADIGCYLQSAAQGQLFQNVVHVALHRICRDVEFLGDLLVAQAVGNQCNDSPFTLCHADSTGRSDPSPFECLINNMKKK
jgi:hypothetical protein